MISVIQRVSEARVVVDGATIATIGAGLLALVCAERGDGQAQADKLLAKILKLRIFSDEAGKMNRSVVDVAGALLLVSQFTLCAESSKGTRPSFAAAMAPGQAAVELQALVSELRKKVPVETGRFGAMMAVELENDGPVTLWLDSRGGP